MKLIWCSDGYMFRLSAKIKFTKTGRFIIAAYADGPYSSYVDDQFTNAAIETIVLHSMYSYIKSLK